MFFFAAYSLIPSDSSDMDVIDSNDPQRNDENRTNTRNILEGEPKRIEYSYKRTYLLIHKSYLDSMDGFQVYARQ